jgi:hypothetical protein
MIEYSIVSFGLSGLGFTGSEIQRFRDKGDFFSLSENGYFINKIFCYVHREAINIVWLD